MALTALTALPVYNEANHVDAVLEAVLTHASDVLIVDDGSTDGTSDLLARRTDIRLVTHPVNRGYGAALITAFDVAIEEGFDAIVTIDCDGQHEPERIPELVAQLEQQDVDILSGSRYLLTDSMSGSPPEDRRQINASITRRLNGTLGLSLTDAFCGFKAYRTAALRRLAPTEPGYAMPLQLWVQAVASGLRIAEHPVPLIYLEEERSFGGSLDDASLRMSYYDSVLDEALTTLPAP